VTNLAALLLEAAVRFPLRSAVRLRETILSYAELNELSARVAGGLSAHGVRAGDRVGMMVPYAPAFPVLYFGALRVGAIVLPMHPRTESAAARPRGDARGARLVFTSHDTTQVDGVETGDTTAVPVGPDFLTQMGLWPQAQDVVSRADEDLAVMVPAEGPANSPHSLALSHGTLREHAVVAARRALEQTFTPGTSEFPGSGQSHGLNAVMLAGACLAFDHASTAPVSRALPGRRMPADTALPDGTADSTG